MIRRTGTRKSLYPEFFPTKVGAPYCVGGEDYTAYDEADPHGDITVESKRISFENMRNSDEAHVTKDFGADYFDGDYHFQVRLKVTAISNWAGFAPWTVAAEIMDWNSQGTIDSVICYRAGAQLRISIQLYRPPDLSESDTTPNDLLSYDTDYWLDITRSGNKITCKIYDDEAMTSLLDTLTVNPAWKNSTRYLCGLYNMDGVLYNGDPSLVATGYADCLKVL